MTEKGWPERNTGFFLITIKLNDHDKKNDDLDLPVDAGNPSRVRRE